MKISTDIVTDPICAFVVNEAKKINATQVVLFGSQARHDARNFSDYDFAISGNYDHNQWARFTLDVEENLPALRNIDLVDLNSASREMRTSIEREGIVLFKNE